jgi:hypothetical protein
LSKALPSIPRQDLFLIAQDVVGLAALEAFSKSL